MRAALSFLGLAPPSSSSPPLDEARLRSRLKEIRVRFHPDRHLSASDEDAALNRHIVHMAEQATSQIMRGSADRAREGEPTDDDAKRRRKQRAWDELEELIASMRAYRSCDEEGEEDRRDAEEEAERPSSSRTRWHPSPEGDCDT